MPVPALAAELATVSPDGLTWTVKLKPGVKFHDGSDMTADDVVQSCQLAISPNCTYSPAVCLAGLIEKVEKIDDAHSRHHDGQAARDHGHGLPAWAHHREQGRR